MLLMVYRTPGASRERRHTDTSTGGLMVEQKKQKTKNFVVCLTSFLRKTKTNKTSRLEKCVPAKHARL